MHKSFEKYAALIENKLEFSMNLEFCENATKLKNTHRVEEAEVEAKV